MATLNVEHITYRYSGSTHLSVDDFSLTVPDGTWTTLCGPAGAGKSSLLRVIAGLEPAQRGRILLSHRDVTPLEPRDRNISIVFQNSALYPQMTISENMAYALHVAHVAPTEQKRRVNAAADAFGISDLLDRLPSALTAEQRLRVAIGRAIIRRPDVLLLDEPLAGLDIEARDRTRAQIIELTSNCHVTTVYTTHSLHEALNVHGRLCIIAAGHHQQTGTIEELRAGPQTLAVARFLARPALQVFNAEVHEGVVAVGDFRARVHGVGGAVRIAAPADAFVLASQGTGTEFRVIDATAPEHLNVEADDPGRSIVTIPWHYDPPARRSVVRLDIDPTRISIFDAEGMSLPFEPIVLFEPTAQPSNNH